MQTSPTVLLMSRRIRDVGSTKSRRGHLPCYAGLLTLGSHGSAGYIDKTSPIQEFVSGIVFVGEVEARQRKAVIACASQTLPIFLGYGSSCSLFGLCFFVVLDHTELDVETGHFIDEKVLEDISGICIAVVEPDKLLIGDMLAGDADIEPLLIELAQLFGHGVGALIAFNEVHEVCFDEEHLLLGELGLNQGNAALCEVALGDEAGFLGDVVESGACVGVEDIGDGAVGFDAGVELDGFEGAVDILVGKADDVIGELGDAVLVEPPRAADDHFVGLVAAQIFEAHFGVTALKSHIDGIEAGFLHLADGILGENIEADVAGTGESDFFLVHFNEGIEPIGEHIEDGIAEVDELDIGVLGKQGLQIENGILGGAEAGVDLLIGIDFTEVAVAAVGAVIEASAADHDDGSANLGGFEVIVIEEIEIGDGKAVEVGEEGTDGVLLDAAVGELEVEALHIGIVLTCAHLIAELQLCIFAVAHTDTVYAIHRQHFVRDEGTVIAAADDEDIGADLAGPLDIELCIGEGCGTDGEADDVELAQFGQLTLEFILFVEIEQVHEAYRMTSLFEHCRDGGKSFAVVAAAGFCGGIAVGVVGIYEQHTCFSAVQIFHFILRFIIVCFKHNFSL